MKTMNAKAKAMIIEVMETAATYEDIKKAYVETLREYAGNKSALEFIDKVFLKNVENVKNIHRAKSGETYEKPAADTPDEFMALIAALLEMDGVTVEVCGTWLWVSGNTKENKEALKTCGFRWAAKKKMWFKAPAGTRHYHGKKSWDMKKIRDVYGSKIVDDAEEVAAAV